MARIPTPSSILLVRATAKAKLDAQKEQSAAIRAQMGLTGQQLVKLKPLSEERKSAIAAFKFGKR
jgi:hypothetical protein